MRSSRWRIFLQADCWSWGRSWGRFCGSFRRSCGLRRHGSAEFFELLPRTHGAAARLACEHDERLKGRACTEVAKGVKKSTPIRHAMEIRDESFACEEFVELLREHDVALVVADTVAWPLLFDVTADFVYVRLHGSEELYASGYEDVALEEWAERVVAWATGGRAEGRRACETEAEAVRGMSMCTSTTMRRCGRRSMRWDWRRRCGRS